MSSTIRSWLRPSSLRARLILWYLLMLGGALAALAVVVFAARSRSLHRELDVELEILAHEAATSQLPALLSLDPGRQLLEDRDLASSPVALRRMSGEVLFRSPAFPDLGWTGERETAAVARAGRSLITVRDAAGVPVRVATLPVPRPGAESLALQIAVPTTRITRNLRTLALTMAVCLVFVLSLASYGGAVIARRTLAPVDDIVRRVCRLRAAHVGERLDMWPGSEELDRLVITLNEMLDRIEVSVRSARRFAADASHELQTPLATMRSALEVCLRDGHGDLDSRALASDMLVELERVSALVRDLRLLSLAQAGHLLDGVESLDVAELTEESCEIAQVLAEERQIRVDTFVSCRPVVRGSALHLGRVLLNLLQNAIRYSPEVSTVRVTVGRAKDYAMVLVMDHGCGIEPGDIPHVFEPFYRADPARAGETGGTGLGLAIADEIVKLHGGSLRVGSTPGRGSVFAVYLPLSIPDQPTDSKLGDARAVAATARSVRQGSPAPSGLT